MHDRRVEAAGVCLNVWLSGLPLLLLPLLLLLLCCQVLGGLE